MTIRHVSCLTFVEGATPQQRVAVLDALATLPGLVPEIRAYAFGPDLGLAGGNADLAIVADFADEEAYRRYAEHPAHLAVLTDHVRPILASRAAAQIRLGA